MAAAGAAGLAVIFGATDLLTLVVIAVTAGLGACLRRGVSLLSANAFAQPLLAAAMAGLVAGLAATSGLGAAPRLVAVCPCMILVPGPHILNGAIDVMRARVALGASRLFFAVAVICAICAGLLLGLAAIGTSLAPGGPIPRVPFGHDVVAAGVAVAAYGSFFNMAWRTLPIPIVTGMLVHALHWELLSAGASVQAGALATCLVAGAVMAPVSGWLRLPFGALAFASVVSLIPGIFLFQAAAQAVVLSGGRSAGSMGALLDLVSNATTAFLVVVGMTFGLIAPKMGLDQLAVIWAWLHRGRRTERDRFDRHGAGNA